MSTSGRAWRGDSAKLVLRAGRASPSLWLRSAAMMAAGAVISGVLFWTLDRFESDRIALEFKRDAKDRVAAFQVSLVHSLDSLSALDALFRSSSSVTRRDFRAFVGEHLLEEPGVAFLGWAPRVVSSDREVFESARRVERDLVPEMADALARYRIFEAGPQGPVPVGDRAEYFPVHFGEPVQVARHTLGFDLASDPVQQESVARAIYSGSDIVSRRDSITPEQPNRFGVLVVNPVYADSGTEERGDLLGLLVGMFDVGNMVEGSLESLEPRGVDVAIYDLEASEETSLLYYHSSRLAKEAGEAWTSSEAAGASDLLLAETMEVADGRWLVSCRPAPGYVEARESKTALLALLSGLALSLLLAGGYFAVSSREAEARAYATDLLDAKKSLEREMVGRRRSESALDRSKALHDAILDKLPLNVFLKDAEGRIQFLNAKGLELVGRSAEEVLGKTDFDLFPEGVARSLRDIDRQVLATGETYSAEEEILVGGEARQLLAGKTALKIEGVETPYLLGFSVDISELKRAERALRESEHRFRHLVENMSSGVAIYQAVDGGEDFVVRDYNPAAERMDGVARSELLGRRVTEIFPSSAEMGVLDALRRVWKSGEAEDLPARECLGATRATWRENSLYKLPSGDLVAVFDDVTEQRRLQADLLQAQKMEAVGRLAGGVAHDFNNLLQVVAGNIDLLQEDGLDDDEARVMLEEVSEQVDRGAQLAQRLLVFSRRDASEPADVDLRDVISGMSRLIHRMVRENVEVQVELGGEPLPVRADHGQLEQVVMNLVVNASDAMKDGGRLRILTEPVGTTEVCLCIADTGPGLEEGLIERIFDPYFTTKTAEQGTGLGLSVVDGIVSMHGGRIEVENHPGEGVEFRIYLSRVFEPQRVEPTPEAREPEAPIRGAGESVLIVEDQKLVRRTMHKMLGRLGYRVTAAATGSEARELFARDGFEVLVTDMVLPDATGVELAREFRSVRAEIAVLLVSGYADEELQREAEGLLFLRKPFQIRQLAEQVAAALAERPGPRMSTSQ